MSENATEETPAQRAVREAKEKAAAAKSSGATETAKTETAKKEKKEKPQKTPEELVAEAKAKEEARQKRLAETREKRIKEKEEALKAREKKGMRTAEPITHAPHLAFTHKKEIEGQAKPVEVLTEINGLNYLEAVQETPVGEEPSILDKLTRGPAISVKNSWTEQVPEDPENEKSKKVSVDRVEYLKYQPGDSEFWETLNLVFERTSKRVEA